MLISICIPAYKNARFLRRLMDSIAVQGFRDFEVVLTDDSPDDEAGNLCREYSGKFELQYHRNEKALGTPENWNAAMRLARGEWIKLMHDDDWFAGPESLGEFKKAIEANPEAGFIFSAYENVFLDENRSRIVHAKSTGLKQLLIDPVTLFSSNVIGPPSVVIHRNDRNVYYDPQVKWVVDIDFYISYLDKQAFFYLDKPLVKVGIGKEQVTRDCFRQRLVEIPEAFYLLEKTGVHHLENILVYDGWWRLMRNLEIRKPEDIRKSGYIGHIPVVIRSMISWQKKYPLKLLRVGVFSKSLMFLNYIFNKKRIE